MREAEKAEMGLQVKRVDELLSYSRELLKQMQARPNPGLTAHGVHLPFY